MSRQTYLTLVILTLTLLHQTNALNILAIVSMPLRSHYMTLQMLFHELASKGHNVTVVNNYPDEDPAPRMEFIDLESAAWKRPKPTIESFEGISSSMLELYNVYKLFFIGPVATTDDCDNLFSKKYIKEHLARKIKYDVIFVEQFISECALVYAAAFYDAPIIGITTHVLLPAHYPRLGMHYDISADPHYFFNTGSKPSLWDKVKIAIVDFLINTVFKWTNERSLKQVFAKHLPNYTVDVEQIANQRMKMMFSYQHHSITGGRRLAPQLLEIAGIHIREPRTVPKDIEDFLSKAEHGAIYVSFGSMLKTNTMTDQKRQQFLGAFKRIPQKVIWKWENASLPEGNDHIYSSAWLPQLDILCHPKILAFISHGGMASMSEAAHCGVPLLTVPFFGDQFNNAAAARESGLGLTMFMQEINTDNLVEAVKELTSERMQSNAKRVSRLWHDRPQPVMDSAIYWTEYVARHRDAPPSLPTKQSAWFQPHLLDVACLIIAIIFVILYLFYTIFRLFLKFVQMLCKRKDKKE